MSERHSVYLDELERQLADRVRDGIHQRRRGRAAAAFDARDCSRSRSRRSRVQWLAVAGTALITLAIAAIGMTALHARRPGPTATGPHRPGAGGRAAAGALGSAHGGSAAPSAVSSSTADGGTGFALRSFTAISEVTWWLLGASQCSHTACLSILHTVNGGRSFSALSGPPTNQVDELRFADQSDGFAYGPQLWATHDGGRRWHRVGIAGAITEMAFADGFAYALVRERDGDGRLLRAPVDTDEWVAVGAAGDAYTGLWAHGSDVLLETQRPGGISGTLMISEDDGASFVARTPPLNIACQFEGQGTPVIWADCSTGMLSSVSRSVDGGDQFAAAAGTAAGRLPALPNLAVFAAASPGTAVVGYRRLYRTVDGGTTYEPVPAPGGVSEWQYLGFTDATHGVALGSVGASGQERLYYTTDAGASYHEVPIR